MNYLRWNLPIDLTLFSRQWNWIRFCASLTRRRIAPRELNYGAMIYSLIARVVERPETRSFFSVWLRVSIIGRCPIWSFLFTHDYGDQWNRYAGESARRSCGSSDPRRLHHRRISCHWATHFEARDKPEAAVKKEKPAPKKRGRKLKSEQAEWASRPTTTGSRQDALRKRDCPSIGCLGWGASNRDANCPEMGHQEKQ